MTRFCTYAYGSRLLENSRAFKTQPSAALGRIMMLDFVIRNEDRLPRRLVVEQKKPYEIILISRCHTPTMAETRECNIMINHNTRLESFTTVDYGTFINSRFHKKQERQQFLKQMKLVK
nr:dual specificity protein phosphatase PHS1 [Tanacetum cinerariifolium]